MGDTFDKREYMGLEELEEYSGISLETIKKWLRPRGDLPALQAFKPGKRLMIRKKDFDLYIKQFPYSAA